MAKIEIKGKGPTMHDLDIKIDGHEISMLKGIKLSFACDEYNYAEIGFFVDEVDIDAEALAVLQAEYVKKQRSEKTEFPCVKGNINKEDVDKIVQKIKDYLDERGIIYF